LKIFLFCSYICCTGTLEYWCISAFLFVPLAAGLRETSEDLNLLAAVRASHLELKQVVEKSKSFKKSKILFFDMGKINTINCWI